jgi:hypothetical protein
VNRAEQLKRAIRKARLPASAVVVYDTLTDRTDWTTAHLPDKHQPRSLKELAAWAGQSKSVTVAALDELEAYGWVRRGKPAILRRGLSTTYQPCEGRARPPRSRPLNGWERTRRWRERKAADQAMRDAKPGPMVTEELDRKSDHETVTDSQVNATTAQWAAVGGNSGPVPSPNRRQGWDYWPSDQFGAEANRGLPWQPDRPETGHGTPGHRWTA